MSRDEKALEFEAWWKDFIEPGRHSNDPRDHSPDGRLGQYVDQLHGPLRQGFLSELADVVVRRGDGWWAALETLETRNDPASLAKLAAYADRLWESPKTTDQDVVCQILRALVLSKDPAHRELIDRYLLRDPIKLYWSSVPWLLWPSDPALFGRSWARYFAETPVSDWRDNAISQSFLNHADALACVRDALRERSGDHWPALRRVMLDQISAPWLSDEDRARLREVCGE